MDINMRKGLKGLLAARNESKDVIKSQAPANLPSPPLPPLPSPLGLHPDPNLQKKKRKGKEIEDGEIIPSKDSKQQKMNKDRQRRETSVKRKQDSLGAKVHRPQRTWAPRLELDSTPIPWDALVWCFQGWHLGYIAEALEQPLLLPRDMDTVRHLKQLDLFLSLKRDLAMLNSSTYL